jgi:aspartyl/asparaginyl-tRNA synthetase
MVFLQLRQQTETVQGVVALSKDGEEEAVSKQMIKWVNGVPVSSSMKHWILEEIPRD